MTPETKKSNQSDYGFLLDHKGPRLPSGIRKYIRRLKEEGELDKAMALAKELREKKREGLIKTRTRPQEELNIAVLDILESESEDPRDCASKAARVVWYRFATGDIDNTEEREEQLGEIFESVPPEEQDAFGEELAGIRDEAMGLRPRV